MISSLFYAPDAFWLKIKSILLFYPKVNQTQISLHFISSRFFGSENKEVDDENRR
jgi:hypothetical protein